MRRCRRGYGALVGAGATYVPVLLAMLVLCPGVRVDRERGGLELLSLTRVGLARVKSYRVVCLQTGDT